MNKLVRESKIFQNLTEENYQAILRCFYARFVTYKKGSTIVDIGDDVNNIYYIVKGHARSYIIDINGEASISNDYYQDDIFGVNYVSNEIPTYKEELKAIEDTIVVVCDGFRFLNPCENRCKRHIDVLKYTFQRQSELLFKSSFRTYTLCKSKTREKILTYLKDVKSKTKKQYFEIPYNQTELAQYLGLERSALSYELNKLKKDGIIDFYDKTYRILKK